jgi:hypothetical protein
MLSSTESCHFNQSSFDISELLGNASIPALTNNGNTLDFISIGSFVSASNSIFEDGLLEFITNLFGGLKYTIGFPSDPTSTTVSFGIILLPAKRILDGANILPSPFIIGAVLSPGPRGCPLPSPIGLHTIRSAVFVGSTINPSCNIQQLSALP